MLILQWIGGGCYLLNKVFLSFSERARKANLNGAARRWRISSWIAYLAGVPAWVILFGIWHNWIVMAVEASAVPAMVLGLMTSIRGINRPTPRWLDHLALACIPFGLVYSVYDFGGLNTLRQCLEIGVSVGFLVGTYQLAKECVSGYLWLMVMHVSCGTLFWVQDSLWLMLHQIISLGFIVDAFNTQRRSLKT